MIVLDTNVLSELMRASPHPQVLGWLDREDARGLFVSAVSEAEIRTGSWTAARWTASARTDRRRRRLVLDEPVQRARAAL